MTASRSLHMFVLCLRTCFDMCVLLWCRMVQGCHEKCIDKRCACISVPFYMVKKFRVFSQAPLAPSQIDALSFALSCILSCTHSIINCCPRWLVVCAAQYLEVNRSTVCRYKEADLNVGETSCVDRCTSKYWQVRLPWQPSCVMQSHEALMPPSDIALCLHLERDSCSSE